MFASARIPTLEFHSTTIIETPTGLDITGTLRIRDVSRTVELHATKTTGPDAPRYAAEMVVSPQGLRNYPPRHYQATNGSDRRHPAKGLRGHGDLDSLPTARRYRGPCNSTQPSPMPSCAGSDVTKRKKETDE